MKKFLLVFLFLFGLLFVAAKYGSFVYALDCSSCTTIVDNQWCTGAGNVVCTGPNPPAWTRAESKCCRGTSVTCDWNNWRCLYYSPDNCQTCYTTYTYYQCTSNCFNADCCSGGNIIAGHCETAVGANPACWFGGKYKTCCKNDGSGQEAPCSVSGDCPSQYGKNLCPPGYSITAPGVTTCTAATRAPTPTSASAPTPTSASAPTPTPGSWGGCGSCNTKPCTDSGGSGWNCVLDPNGVCLYDSSCQPPPSNNPSSISCSVSPTKVYSGNSVTIDVTQNPNLSRNGSCYYKSIDAGVYKLDPINRPLDRQGCIEGAGTYVGKCTATGFNPNGKTQSCVYTPVNGSGAYCVTVYYGGHSDQGHWQCDPPDYTTCRWIDGCADSAAWGRCSFSVANPNSPPAAPTLSSPANGSVCQSTNLTLSWNAVSNWGVCYPTQTNQYLVYVDDNSDFSSPVVNGAATTGTSYTASLSAGITYYWKVVASNGCLTASSSTWSFTTAPSGSFQLSPSSLVSIRLGESAPGAYQVVPNSPATFNQITFTGYNNLITVDPPKSNVSGGKIAIIANSTTTGTTTITGTAYLNPGSCPLPAKQIPVSVVAPGPWWQTKDGDVHAKGDIASHIPAIAAVDNKYLSLTGDGGSPGVVSYGSTLSLGSGSVSKSDFFWQAKTDKGSKVNFDYLKNRLKVNTNNTFNPTQSLPNQDGTYYYPGNGGEVSLLSSLNSDWNIGNHKIVLFVDNADVVIDHNITVNQGGFFALIVKGKLTFTGGVQNAQGFHLSNGDMTIQASSNKFQGEGSFISWGDIIFKRDRQDIDYNKTPAEFFVFRPDLLVNAPKDFLFHPFVFQEVAP